MSFFHFTLLTLVAQTGTNAAIVDIDAQILQLNKEMALVQANLDKFQDYYEKEVSGARRGAPGIGPLARAIEKNEIAPPARRDKRIQLSDP